MPQAIIELVHGLHQADVSFLNEIEKVQARIGVILGDAEDKSEIRAHELVLRVRHLRFVLVDQR